MLPILLVLFMNSLMQTYSGLTVDFDNISRNSISIKDVAHALSITCRWNGHTKKFYSVAEHSILAATHAINNNESYLDSLFILLHDASEAYVSDVASPIKKFFPTYMDMEEKIQVVIAEKFDLPYPMPKQITEMDYKVLATEKRDLLGEEPASWGRLPNPLDEIIVPMTPIQSKAAFTKRFKELFRPLDYYRAG